MKCAPSGSVGTQPGDRARADIAARSLLRWSVPLWALLCAAGATASGMEPTASHPGCPPLHVQIPDRPLQWEGVALPFQNGFFVVPENRSEPGSRCILVRYLRFPARSDSPEGLVVMLPGGPGVLLDADALERSPGDRRAIHHVTRTRDLVVLQQRGVTDGAHAPSLSMQLPALPLDSPADAAAVSARSRTALQEAIDQWTTLGVDLRGYHVLEMVADLDTLVDLLGYPRFAIYATSFGSQWALSYLKKNQQRVERAVLTGVEPLDYTYDSPQWLWQAYERIGEHARRHPALSGALADQAMMDIYRRVLGRLERAPERVTITDRRTGATVDVVLGPDDLRRALPYPVPGTRREGVESLPRFLLELDRGDYRYLAALAHRERQPRDTSMLLALVDNALGITAERDTRLRNEEASRWLGDVNAYYTATRDLTPTADVGDDFRADFQLHLPVLMVQGDLDLSTPLENALSQAPYLQQGHVLTVEGGTHAVRNELLLPEVTGAPAEIGMAMLEFLAPTTPADPIEQLRQLPERVPLAPFDFQGLTTTSLYEEWLREAF